MGLNAITVSGRGGRLLRALGSLGLHGRTALQCSCTLILRGRQPRCFDQHHAFPMCSHVPHRSMWHGTCTSRIQDSITGRASGTLSASWRWRLSWTSWSSYAPDRTFVRNGTLEASRGGWALRRQDLYHGALADEGCMGLRGAIPIGCGVDSAGSQAATHLVCSMPAMLSL